MASYRDILLRHDTLSAPEITRKLNNSFCRLIGVPDPFVSEKENSNHSAFELYKEWKPKVRASKNPFYHALRLAIAGNIMDYGANNSFDVHQTIELVMSSGLQLTIPNCLSRKSKRLKLFYTLAIIRVNSSSIDCLSKPSYITT